MPPKVKPRQLPPRGGVRWRTRGGPSVCQSPFSVTSAVRIPSQSWPTPGLHWPTLAKLCQLHPNCGRAWQTWGQACRSRAKIDRRWSMFGTASVFGGLGHIRAIPSRLLPDLVEHEAHVLMSSHILSIPGQMVEFARIGGGYMVAALDDFGESCFRVHAFREFWPSYDDLPVLVCSGCPKPCLINPERGSARAWHNILCAHDFAPAPSHHKVRIQWQRVT